MNIISFGTFSKDLYYSKNLHPIKFSEYSIDWFDKIKTSKSELNNIKTVAACPSFNEIYNEGFVILAPTDYKFIVTKEKQLFWETAFSFKDVTNVDDVEFHFNEQYVNYMPKNFNIKMIVKINTPWKLFTPKGYSIRIMELPLTINNKWNPTYGILRTDKNYHLNFQLNIKTNEEILIKQGDPLALIVPFKRENYKHKVINLNKKNEFSIKYYSHYLKTYGSFKRNFRKDYWLD